jgi:hypothetical protein
MRFAAVFRKVPEGYLGFVEELPGAVLIHLSSLGSLANRRQFRGLAK